MQVADAQREIRTVYLNGAVGSLVSAVLWLKSAALATWMSPRAGILVLVVGGMFIFPVTQLLLKLMGRPARVGRDNPLPGLAMQVAFTIPLTLPVVAGATLHRLDWFYPAAMLIVGAHYLPFIFLYGMRHYAVIAGALIGAGLMLGMYGPRGFALGGWLGGALLLAFAAWVATVREPAQTHRAAA
jgi:hypothetical protein